jgi:formylglycine-generating enzyme required for sulfatase activity
MVNFFTLFLFLFIITLLFSCSEDNINNTSREFVEMVSVPTGAFEMGFSEGDPAEMPVHIVKITKEFYIGIYEITQIQFKAVMGYNPSQNTGNDNNPVESISWLDAVQFCNELSIIKKLEPCYSLVDDTLWVCDFTKKGYRLPTEAEWEYACRAGTTKNFDNDTEESYLDSIAWYKINSYNTTHKVGTKKPNPFGMYDMHGNVSEMVWDFYYHYQNGITEDPVGPDIGMFRIIRGGSWKCEVRDCRASIRLGSNPNYKSNDIGFRVARTK